MTSEAPIHIVGGGLAGCALAIQLAENGWPITLYEAESWEVPSARVPRTLALTESSWRALENCGISLNELPHAAIEEIHVSQKAYLGQVTLRARDENKERYGATIAYDTILRALRHRVDQTPRIEVKSEHRVDGLKPSKIAAQLTLRTPDGGVTTVCAPLVVVAEGGKGLEDPRTLRWSYQTSALSCRVRSDDPVTTTAYERFTPQGPMAFLPAKDGWAVIWTGPDKDIQRLMGLDDHAFLSELQLAFGDRVGRLIETTPRMPYPLRAGFSLSPVDARVVRIGNAAQTLHPVAGQGFNLGLRDVGTLVALLDRDTAKDPGRTPLLNAYAKERRRDRGVTGLLTHLLAGGFTLPIPALRPVASLLFLGLDISPTLKHVFAEVMSDGVSP